MTQPTRLDLIYGLQRLTLVDHAPNLAPFQRGLGPLMAFAKPLGRSHVWQMHRYGLILSASSGWRSMSVVCGAPFDPYELSSTDSGLAGVQPEEEEKCVSFVFTWFSPVMEVSPFSHEREGERISPFTRNLHHGGDSKDSRYEARWHESPSLNDAQHSPPCQTYRLPSALSRICKRAIRYAKSVAMPRSCTLNFHVDT